MVIVKGDKVIFRMRDGSTRKPPPSYGIIHDPDGKELPKCIVFVGPVRRTSVPAAAPSRKAKAYLGRKFPPKKAIVNRPPDSWKPIGEVVEILYERRGKYAGKYFHPFKAFSPTLSRSGRFYRLELRNGCIVDDRGFVFP